METSLIGTWIGAFLTLGIISFLYKDNPWYKFCESVFVGISAGYWFASLFWQSLYAKFYVNIMPAMTGLMHGRLEYNLLYVGAGIFGVMMLMRLIPSVGWISRWPLALVVGATAGLYLINYLVSNAMLQVGSTIRPLVSFPESLAVGDRIANIVVFGIIAIIVAFLLFNRNSQMRLSTFSRLLLILLTLTVCSAAVYFSFGLKFSLVNLIMFVGVFSGLIYFFFSKEHTGIFGGAAMVGTWFLMVTFGAAFGYTVMSRMSLLIGRIDFLLVEWLKLAK